jgi:hypothetical protein
VEREEEGTIDNPDKLKQSPAYIWGTTDDKQVYPILQKLQKRFYDNYSGVVQLDIATGTHNLKLTDPGKAM